MTTNKMQFINPNDYTSGIYKITSTKTGHYYYGSSKRCKYRYQNGHLYDLTHNIHYNKYMQRVYNKHSEGWQFEIIECLEPSREILMKTEQQYLNEHYGKLLCMNISNNAFRAFREGYKHSAATKAKMSAKAFGRKNSPKAIRKMLESRKWYKCSEETKARLRASIANTRCTKEYRDSISKATKAFYQTAKGREVIKCRIATRIKNNQTKMLTSSFDY